MRRRCGCKSILAAESNNVRPSSTMRPLSGRASPANTLINVVLPAPERPKRASSPLPGPLKLAAKRKSPSCFSALKDSMTLARDPPVDPTCQEFGGDKRCQRQHYGDDRKAQGSEIAARFLGKGVDGDGDRARFPRNIADENDRRSELAQAAGKGKDHSDEYARQGQRQGHTQEDVEGIGAQGARRRLEFAIDRLDGEADRTDHQGEGHYGSCQCRPFPGENQRETEMDVEPSADGAAPPEQDQQSVSHHH